MSSKRAIAKHERKRPARKTGKRKQSKNGNATAALNANQESCPLTAAQTELLNDVILLVTTAGLSKSRAEAQERVFKATYLLSHMWDELKPRKGDTDNGGKKQKPRKKRQKKKDALARPQIHVCPRNAETVCATLATSYCKDCDVWLCRLHKHHH